MISYLNNIEKYKETLKKGSFDVTDEVHIEIKLASLEFNNLYVDLYASQDFYFEKQEKLQLVIYYGIFGERDPSREEVSELGNKIFNDKTNNLFDNSQVLKDLVKIMSIEFYDEFTKEPELFKDLQDYIELRENYSFSPKHRNDLMELCNNPQVYLGDIDTSKITDMSGLFEDSEREDFSGIENWDVSNVENMSYMFCNSKFDHDLSKWKLSSLRDASHMFKGSLFSGDLSSWEKWMSFDKINLDGIAENAVCFEIPKNWNLSEEKFLTAIHSSICGSHKEGYWPDLISDNEDAVQEAVSIITKAVQLYKEYSGKINLPNIYRPWSEDDLKKLCEVSTVGLDEINVSDVEDFSYIFKNSTRKSNEFKGIEQWDVSNGRRFFSMFENAKINEDLSSWNIKDKAFIQDIFKNSKMSENNLNKTLNEWKNKGNQDAEDELKKFSIGYEKFMRRSSRI